MIFFCLSTRHRGILTGFCEAYLVKHDACTSINVLLYEHKIRNVRCNESLLIVVHAVMRVRGPHGGP